MSYNRITVPLSEHEEDMLRTAASRACRRPRDHARYIILKSLGLVNDDAPKPEINTRQTVYCIVRDDSGHWYVIPNDQIRAFDEWVEAMSNDDIGYKGIGYDHCRINGSPSNVVFPSYEVL